MSDLPPRVWIVESSPVNRKLLQLCVQKCGGVAEVIEDVVAVAGTDRKPLPDFLFLGWPLETGKVGNLEHFLKSLEQVRVIFCANDINEIKGQVWADRVVAILKRPFGIEDVKRCLTDERLSPEEKRSDSQIDWDLLADVSGDWEQDFIPIVEEFISDVIPMLDNLEQLCEGSSDEESCRAAHSLKGSSANFGFVGFSALMAEAERELKAGRKVAPDLLQRSRVVLNTSIEEVRSHMKLLR